MHCFIFVSETQLLLGVVVHTFDCSTWSSMIQPIYHHLQQTLKRNKSKQENTHKKTMRWEAMGYIFLLIT